MKHLIFLLAVLVLMANFTFVNADSKSVNNELYPSSWDIELKEAKISGDKQKEVMLEQMIYEKTQHMITVPDMNDVDVFTRNVSPVYQPDWLADDVLVYEGDLGASGSGHRRMDMKMGKDGNLYAVALGRPDANFNGRMSFLKSVDGGLTWTIIGSVNTAAAYFGQVSLLVENRSADNNLNPDSTRLVVFYSRSTSSNFDNATIHWISTRQDGQFTVGGVAAITPTAGNRLLYPSAISDGQYYNNSVYFGVVCVEYGNGGELTKFLRYALTTNWGNSFNSTLIEDGYLPDRTDHQPVAAFKKGESIGTDSVYIVTQRKAGGNTAILKIAIKYFSNSGMFSTTLLTPFQGYKLPCITIVQTAASLWANKQIMIGSINVVEGVSYAHYNFSSNSGSSWTSHIVNNPNTEIPSYVSVSSDTNRLDGGYFIYAYQKANGDSIVTKRGTPGNILNEVNSKVNEFKSSPFNSPVVAIYRNGTEKYSALAYSGLSALNWTSNVYFDSENLISSITNTSTIAENYKLEQNFPNPFNPTTTIKFSIPSSSFVKLSVFDIVGREVSTLVNEKLSAGSFEYNFNASELPSGVYFYKLSTNDFSEVKRMMLVK